MGNVKAVVLRTAGTNCDQETMYALRLAGADPELVHINALISGTADLSPYQMMVIPGGFSYGDDIAAGKLLANELRFRLGDPLKKFIAQGKIVIGICNGFQVLVKTGFLPDSPDGKQIATLAANDSGRFQAHWVRLKREKSACTWLNSTDSEWELPIAHGEGKFMTQDEKTLRDLEKNGQVVFRYTGANPNGSMRSIAGVCNKQGNVVGLMPHPERHVRGSQHPEWTRHGWGAAEGVGLQMFQAAVDYSARLS